MILVAHQCGEDKYPRITVEAAKHSLSIGADYAEFDIRHLKDGGLAINHDESGTDLFGKDQKIAETTKEEFLTWRRKYHDGYGALCLEDMLDAGVSRILLHIKEGGAVLQSILETLRRYGVEDSVLIGAQTLDDVKLAKSFNPNIRVLCFAPTSAIEEFLQTDAEIIRVWEGKETQELVDKIHSYGKMCFIMVDNGRCGYTSEDSLRRFAALGCDGILINHIEFAKKVLNIERNGQTL